MRSRVFFCAARFCRAIASWRWSPGGRRRASRPRRRARPARFADRTGGGEVGDAASTPRRVPPKTSISHAASRPARYRIRGAGAPDPTAAGPADRRRPDLRIPAARGGRARRAQPRAARGGARLARASRLPRRRARSGVERGIVEVLPPGERSAERDGRRPATARAAVGAAEAGPGGGAGRPGCAVVGPTSAGTEASTGPCDAGRLAAGRRRRGPCGHSYRTPRSGRAATPSTPGSSRRPCRRSPRRHRGDDRRRATARSASSGSAVTSHDAAAPEQRCPTTPPSRQSTTASTRNCRRMSRARAPTAMRRPISRVRSVTDTSMMFMMPTPPTTSEISATHSSRSGHQLAVWRERLGRSRSCRGR